MTDQLRLATQAIAAGADTQIQYNNAGSVAASANLFWLEGSGVLNLSGTATQLQFYCDGGAQMLFSDTAQSVDFAQISFDTGDTDAINIFNFTNDGAIKLVTDKNGVAPTWSFNPNGSLAIPGLVTVNGNAGALGTFLTLQDTPASGGAPALSFNSDTGGEIDFNSADGTTSFGIITCNNDGGGGSDIEFNTGSGPVKTWIMNTDGGLILAATEEAGIAVPVEGMFIYDNVVKKLKFYNGTAWETVVSA